MDVVLCCVGAAAVAMVSMVTDGCFGDVGDKDEVDLDLLDESLFLRKLPLENPLLLLLLFLVLLLMMMMLLLLCSRPVPLCRMTLFLPKDLLAYRFCPCSRV